MDGKLVFPSCGGLDTLFIAQTRQVLWPNDLADDLAKKAAEEARGLIESPPLSYSEFKNLIKDSSLKKWEKYWTTNLPA